ncbi:MAG: hypothetical protein BWY66_02533 [bacterium ADurb.Bin374]|nr:MAG: hypothetical protein BWY66_02533 [bacterium ADurb.Bin374]
MVGAVPVFPAIGVGGEKLVNEVSVSGVDLDPVEAGLLGAHGGTHEFGDFFPNFSFGERADGGKEIPAPYWACTHDRMSG